MNAFPQIIVAKDNTIAEKDAAIAEQSAQLTQTQAEFAQKKISSRTSKIILEDYPKVYVNLQTFSYNPNLLK